MDRDLIIEAITETLRNDGSIDKHHSIIVLDKDMTLREYLEKLSMEELFEIVDKIGNIYAFYFKNQNQLIKRAKQIKAEMIVSNIMDDLDKVEKHVPDVKGIINMLEDVSANIEQNEEINKRLDYLEKSTNDRLDKLEQLAMLILDKLEKVDF